MTLPRPCLDCGTPTRNGSRCPRCAGARGRARDRIRGSATARGYNSQWAARSQRLREQHLIQHGSVCPGWGRPAHRCPPDELVLDHDVGILCVRCNSRKAATFDKPRRRFSDNGQARTRKVAREPIPIADRRPTGLTRLDSARTDEQAITLEEYWRLRNQGGPG